MRFFITGISRGLGRALAEECLRRGHQVWGVSRSGPSRDDNGMHHTKCDISKFSEVQQAADEMIAAGYIPDVFILNAAAVREDFDRDLDLRTVRETFETGFFGNLYWLTIFGRLLSQKAGGAIFLNISSVAAFRAIVRRKVSYAASKAAMDKVFEGLSIQGGGLLKFITVNLGPLAEKKGFPLITGSYADAAEKIVGVVQAGRAKGNFSYPFAAGVLYRVARFVPDRLIRRLVR
ncbi:MAG: SDR family NAD(P)-dependent oxidoreductase [Nitrospiraceae bacterium]|nr:SDR family NAD(P)-dependent oxidoreductase [Nitrospiraceae bacterium]